MSAIIRRKQCNDRSSHLYVWLRFLTTSSSNLASCTTPCLESSEQIDFQALPFIGDRVQSDVLRAIFSVFLLLKAPQHRSNLCINQHLRQCLKSDVYSIQDQYSCIPQLKSGCLRPSCVAYVLFACLLRNNQSCQTNRFLDTHHTTASKRVTTSCRGEACRGISCKLPISRVEA